MGWRPWVLPQFIPRQGISLHLPPHMHSPHAKHSVWRLRVQAQSRVLREVAARGFLTQFTAPQCTHTRTVSDDFTSKCFLTQCNAPQSCTQCRGGFTQRYHAQTTNPTHTRAHTHTVSDDFTSECPHGSYVKVWALMLAPFTVPDVSQPTETATATVATPTPSPTFFSF